MADKLIDYLKEHIPHETKCTRCNFIGAVQPADAPNTEVGEYCDKTVSKRHVFLPVRFLREDFQPITTGMTPGSTYVIRASIYGNVHRCEGCGLVDDIGTFSHLRKSY